MLVLPAFLTSTLAGLISLPFAVSAFTFRASVPDWLPSCPRVWHIRGMGRIRLSTTVDAELLDEARRTGPVGTDAALIDAALAALLARNRGAAVDASYAAYDERPLEEPDEWGDLASFRRAAGAS